MHVARGVIAIFSSPVCVLVWIVTVADGAFATLLPSFHDGLHLSTLQAGTLVSATTGITLVLALPVGRLADRLGARRLLVAAALFTGAGTALQALGGSYDALLAGRALFGVSYAIIWTATPALVMESGEGAKGMGQLIAAAGFGQLIGPLGAGIVAQSVGLWVPFAAISVAAFAWVVILRFRASSSKPKAVVEAVLASEPSRMAAHVVIGCILIALLGLASSITYLAVPLRLSSEGASPTMIGALLSCAAIVFIITAPIAGSVVRRGIGIRFVAITISILGLVWVVPFGLAAPIVMAVFLIGSSACRAPLNTVVYLLGRSEDPLRRAFVIGILNVVWASASMAGPLIAGALMDSAGPRWPYVLVAVPAIVVGGFLLLSTARPSASTRTPLPV